MGTAGLRILGLCLGVVLLAAPRVLDAASIESSRHFSTLPRGAVLPTEEQCAGMIAATPEVRPGNIPFNRTVPSADQLARFHAHPVLGSEPPARVFLGVDGAYAGSTEMILRWAACKWGVDEDVVKAQAWTESKWIQGGSDRGAGGGDKRFDRRQCVQDGFADLWNYGCENCCFQSWGILQTKVFYAPATWPMIKDSTAFNADYRYAEERACLDGDYSNYFASTAQQPNTYDADIASGDLDRIVWGCTGMHFSGSWFDAAARNYISESKGYLAAKPWLRLLPGSDRE
jgi:hypothetical protein